VTAPPVAIVKVPARDAAQVLLVEHDDMVQAFPPDGTDQQFDVRVLPRGPYRSEHFLYPEVLDTSHDKSLASP